MKLSPLITLSEPGASRGGEALEPIPPPKPWLVRLLRKPFFLLVILPSLIAAFYFYGIAAPQYVSEARFVVHSRGNDGGGPAAALRAAAGGGLGGLGGVMSSGEANSIRNFLSSLDAVVQANEKLDLIELWRRPEADFLARLWFTEPERIARFYNHMVNVTLDPMTGVTTLRVRSFRPEDSRELAETLLISAEDLVNRLSQRARGDTLADRIAGTRITNRLWQAGCLSGRGRHNPVYGHVGCQVSGCTNARHRRVGAKVECTRPE